MNAKIRPITVILCDDIRVEKNNKNILIGVYSDDVVLYKSPKQIVLAAHLIVAVEGTGRTTFEIEIEGPEGSETVRASGNVEISQEAEPHQHIGISMPKFRMDISNPGYLVIKFKLSKGKWRVLRQFPILIQPPTLDSPTSPAASAPV